MSGTGLGITCKLKGAPQGNVGESALQSYDHGAHVCSCSVQRPDYLRMQLGDPGQQRAWVKDWNWEAESGLDAFSYSERVMQLCASKLFPVPGMSFRYPVCLVSSWSPFMV